MAIEFTNLVGDWRRIVEDYVTDPDNAADAPGVEGTITVTPMLGEGRHAPRGVPSGGVFYTFSPLDLRVYRGLLRDENMNADITVAIGVDGYPIAWRAKFDLQYRRIKIPLQDVIFGPDEIVDGQISLSSLVARDGVPPEYEGSYVQLMDAVAQAAGHAATAGTAAALIEANLPAINAAPGHAQRAEDAANAFGLTATTTTGAPGSDATVTVSGDGPAYALGFTVPRGAKGDKGDRGDDGEVSQAALDAAVASLVDNAPEALDTLSELADALGNDPNFATTVSTEIGKRALKDGAPEAYDTLGKLVTALEAGEIGGSTDAADLTGALTTAVDAGGATVSFPGPDDTPMTMSIMVLAATLFGGVDGLAGALDSKSDVGHTHTKAQVGLGNVDNTSDAAKPVSTATQAALDGKEKKAWQGTQSQYDALGTKESDRTYWIV